MRNHRIHRPPPGAALLLDGLERLEYRGYDSAGIALAGDGAVETSRAVGNLAALRATLAEPRSDAPPPASATRAGPRTARVSEDNAHPHSDEQGRVHLVLNGIVENHLELRERLQAAA